MPRGVKGTGKLVVITERGREVSFATTSEDFPKTAKVIRNNDSTFKEIADSIENEFKEQHPECSFREDILPIIVQLTRELQSKD